jgi:uncharacterized membrane protein YraQ (UPF0718 family)
MTPSPPTSAGVGFAERHGPTVLLFVGVALILAGLVAVFTTQQIIAGTMLTTGLVAIVMAAVVGRMEGPFRLFFVKGSLRRRTDGVSN